VSRLRVNIRASNPVLFPFGSLFATGTNTERQLRGFPATNRFGSSTLSIEVSDGGQTVTGRVAVTVRAVNDAPVFPTNSAALAEDFDRVSPPALPAGWTTTSLFGGQAWRSSAASVDSAPNAAFVVDQGFSTDTTLTSPRFTMPAGAVRLRFRHSFSTEQCCDGGFVEIALGSNPFVNIIAVGGIFLSNGYNAGGSWRGTSGGNITTVAQLPSTFAGQTAQLRWHFTTDGSVSGLGWFVDSILLGEDSAPFPSSLTMDEDTTSPPVIFSVDDVESGPDDLRLTVSSSDPALVPPEGLTLSGAGPQRALQVRPATNQFGFASITITASDGFTNTSRSLALTVLPVNDPPQMQPVSNRTVYARTLLEIPMSATDVDGPALTFSLSDPPTGAVINPTNGLFTWEPGPAQVGHHSINVIVSDNAVPGLRDVRSFLVTVVDFGIGRPSLGLAGGITLTWSSLPGATYRVQFKNALSEPAWTDLPGDVAATATLATKADPVPIDAQRFYRIMLLRED
jgi:hypothetical protein